MLNKPSEGLVSKKQIANIPAITRLWWFLCVRCGQSYAFSKHKKIEDVYGFHEDMFIDIGILPIEEGFFCKVVGCNSKIISQHQGNNQNLIISFPPDRMY